MLLFSWELAADPLESAALGTGTSVPSVKYCPVSIKTHQAFQAIIFFIPVQFKEEPRRSRQRGQ